MSPSTRLPVLVQSIDMTCHWEQPSRETIRNPSDENRFDLPSPT
jgi:hypothetical protein